MNKVVKILLAVVAVCVLLVVGLVTFAVMSVNTIARTGIEKGGSYALGVPTTLDSASVGLMSGKFSMRGLNVANPPGFESDRFLGLGSGAVQVSYQSLQSDTIELPTLTLDGVRVNLEKKSGEANYKVILANVKRVTGSDTGDAPPKPAPSDEKKLVINELVITDVVVTIDLFGGDGPAATLSKLTSVTVPIDRIVLKNVGKTGTGASGTGVTLGQLSGILVQALMAAAIQKGGDLLPKDLVGDMQGALEGLGSIKDLGLEVIGGAAVNVQQLGDAAKKAAEEGKKAVEDATEGIRGIIPGQKKD